MQILHDIDSQKPSREIIIVICHAVFWHTHIHKRECKQRISFRLFSFGTFDFPWNEHKEIVTFGCNSVQLYTEPARSSYFPLWNPQHTDNFYLVRKSNGSFFILLTKDITFSNGTNKMSQKSQRNKHSFDWLWYLEKKKCAFFSRHLLTFVLHGGLPSHWVVITFELEMQMNKAVVCQSHHRKLYSFPSSLRLSS